MQVIKTSQKDLGTCESTVKDLRKRMGELEKTLKTRERLTRTTSDVLSTT